MKFTITLLTCFIVSLGCFAQQQTNQNNFSGQLPQIRIKRSTSPVKVDGELNLAEWANSGHTDNFWQYFPTDSVNSIGPTEIKMKYDDIYLYVGVKCHTIGKDFVIPSLKRDYRFGGNDNVTLLFDTYNDKTNAFVFGMNPYGVRREALIANGGRQSGDFNGSWDNKWLGAAKVYDDYWVAEFAIPFKTLRFNAGSDHWRFNCIAMIPNTMKCLPGLEYPVII